MDVTPILAELRWERRQIERAILSLEGFHRRGARATKSEPEALTATKRAKEPGDGSLRQYVDRLRSSANG
jgi:hypothetical protein